MECTRIVFSGHAIQRMFERGIGRAAVVAVIAEGEAIREYADDEPFPSRLLLGWIEDIPIHVVVADDKETRTCIVVTAYEPSAALWAPDFRNRRTV